MGRSADSSLPGVSGAPMWEELVQPGPKGDPEKRAARLARTRLRVLLVDNSTVVPRRERRAVHGRGWNPGRLVRRTPRTVHRAHADAHAPKALSLRLTGCGAGSVDPFGNAERDDVQARRAARAGRAS